MTVAIDSISHMATWSHVERLVERARERHRTAKTAAEFASVGELCSEALVVLSVVTYAINSDRRGGNSEVRLSDSLLDVLRRHISRQFTGPSRDDTLAYLEKASRTCVGTKDGVTGKLCLTATEGVVGVLAESAGRRSKETIRELIERFMRENTLGQSHGYVLGNMGRNPIGERIASELTAEDLIDYARRRREMPVIRTSRKVSGATINQEITYLRSVFKTARDDWQLNVSTDAIDNAKRILKEQKLIGPSAPRTKRPTREELQRIVECFAQREKHARSIIPMRDIMEFSLWTARRLGEICELRWEDLDDKEWTCKVFIRDARGKSREHVFPLLGKARDIIIRQPKKPSEPRIFPFNASSASQAYADVKKRLGIENLRFQDLRREAAIRLYEAGHSVEQIAKVTGRMDLNTLLRDIERVAGIPAQQSAN